MRQLVEVLVDVHEVDPVAASAVRPFAVYAQASYLLPKWVTKPALWDRAIEIPPQPGPGRRSNVHPP